MRRSLTALVALVAMAAAVGCSTTHTLAQSPGRVTLQHHSLDAVYVEQVEKMARKRGVRVHWVNAPVRVH